MILIFNKEHHTKITNQCINMLKFFNALVALALLLTLMLFIGGTLASMLLVLPILVLMFLLAGGTLRVVTQRTDHINFLELIETLPRIRDISYTLKDYTLLANCRSILTQYNVGDEVKSQTLTIKDVTISSVIESPILSCITEMDGFLHNTISFKLELPSSRYTYIKKGSGDTRKLVPTTQD